MLTMFSIDLLHALDSLHSEAIRVTPQTSLVNVDSLTHNIACIRDPVQMSCL